ncbi:DUF488 domain-containing protein [Herbaspirillum huttiense]|uniref:DUF488 domain-containing protein n=1 Tax=Herbaspirillum huttiense TaxID=863372 RepID=UPI0039AFB7BC
MAISVVQLGTPRAPDEGLRIGSVRRPPRGIPKAEFGKRNYYDIWLPILSPSPELLAKGKLADSDSDWNKFASAFRRELVGGEADKILDLLVALSSATNFAIGCYCNDENRCHRSILRQLLNERGASLR